jgi:hypothetical protein
LKKDIINLLSIVIQDIAKNQITKRYAMILRLVQLATTIAQLISDYRNCKSLLDDILALLRLINDCSIVEAIFMLINFNYCSKVYNTGMYNTGMYNRYIIESVFNTVYCFTTLELSKR